MITKIVEVTNNNFNWGKFMLMRPDVEWEYKSRMDESCPVPLLRQCGWNRDHLWVLDLQTGEGACFKPKGFATADLKKHQVWVCPMFEPFLNWLYQQDLTDITKLPGRLDLPDVEGALYGYRRPGKSDG